MNYWMVKQEPEAYSWADFLRDGVTSWTGVRNYQARIYLRAMRKGDAVFFYHSVTEKQVVGLAKVAKENYPDPTAGEGDWSAVDLKPSKRLKRPVTLAELKSDPVLRTLPLIRQSRLSVLPVSPEQAARLLELGNTGEV